MKFCLHFYKFSSLLNEADELMINYDGQDKDLVKFLQEHTNQRIILDIRDIEGFINNRYYEAIKAIKETYPDFKIVLRFSELNNTLVLLCTDAGIDFFFDYKVTTFEQLKYFISIGVSDVYLWSDICFNIKAASKMCADAGVKIRIVPNAAQSSIEGSESIKKFFIRPEDLHLYEPYVDTVEFDYDSIEKQGVYHSIYFKDKEWFGDLDNLIKGLNLSVPNTSIIPAFGAARLECGKKCALGRCNICDRIYSISKSLNEKDLIVRQQKDL